jgi:pimeloyl-ACP methyl ester carboxylesterase
MYSASHPTALQLAGRHPERVSKVILQNAVRSYARVAPLSALKMMMGSLSTLDPAQVVATMSQRQQQAALALLLASRSGSGFLHDLHHRCGDLLRITAPTLIIVSKYDGSMDASHANYAADHIPNAELYVSPAESHLLWFSSYNAAIEEKMRAFLQASRVSG